MPREFLPKEFERDHKIAQAFYNPGEEIWRRRLSTESAVRWEPRSPPTSTRCPERPEAEADVAFL